MPEDTKNSKQAQAQKNKKEEALSEEDQAKKAELELLVERSRDINASIQKIALESLRSEIRTSTSSMTSVPKPLKFLRSHYDSIKEYFFSGSISDQSNKELLADILSVLAMTMSKQDSREALSFKLQGSKQDIGSWGHEYVKHLSSEIGEEFADREGKELAELELLIDQIVPYNMQHNAEPDACDLLLDVERLDKLLADPTLIDEKNYARVCTYLVSCANYIPEPEDAQILKVVLEIYKRMNKIPDALAIALKLQDNQIAYDLFKNCQDPLLKKQLAFSLARQCTSLQQLAGADVVVVEEEDEVLQSVLSNSTLSENFLTLGRDLEISDPRHPDDIIKSDNKLTSGVDSHRSNLAATFVNCFANAGFAKDKLILEDGKWIEKNKEQAMLSAVASLGMLLLWDVDSGLSQIDKYTYSTDDNIKAGAYLAIGIVNSQVKNSCDPALALLTQALEGESSDILKKAAILGLGIAYAGTEKEGILELLTPIFEDPNANIEVVSMAGLALGQVYAGTCNGEAATLILQTFIEKDETTLANTHVRFLSLGLGLLFIGKQEAVDMTVETLKVLSGPTGKYAIATVGTCAYVATGNVLKIQALLSTCCDHLEKDNEFQSVLVLGIAMIAMGEEIGTEMALRTFDHILQYGEPHVRKAVPLALGLSSVSNPRIAVMDTLSKLTHDSTPEVAINAVFGLGLIGAGTNNSRIGALLRQLPSYTKNADIIFMVKIAQGLLHMGKGTLTLSPFHTNGLLTSKVSFAGLLTVLHACLDAKNTILGKSHYLLFSLASSMYPRMLMTFDEDMKMIGVSVRVGQAVDVIGQAGRPKTITGFQTHTTPVLLGAGERAELATDEYVPLTSVLEGFVILRKKEGYVANK